MNQMIFDPYNDSGTTNALATACMAEELQAPTTKLPLRVVAVPTTPTEGHDDAIEDVEDPLCDDALHGTPDEFEVERQRPRRHSRHSSSGSIPVSPIERIKAEEDHANETVSALWGSEHDNNTFKSRERRSSYISNTRAHLLQEHGPLRAKSIQYALDIPSSMVGCPFCMTILKQEVIAAQNVYDGPPLRRFSDCQELRRPPVLDTDKHPQRSMMVQVNRGAW